jgi:hypothetical protein
MTDDPTNEPETSTDADDADDTEGHLTLRRPRPELRDGDDGERIVRS